MDKAILNQQNKIKLFKLIRIRQCSVQFSSVAQSCRTLCDPMNRSTPGRPVQGCTGFVIIHWAVHLWCEPLFCVPVSLNKAGRGLGWTTAAGPLTSRWNRDRRILQPHSCWGFSELMGVNSTWWKHSQILTGTTPPWVYCFLISLVSNQEMSRKKKNKTQQIKHIQDTKGNVINTRWWNLYVSHRRTLSTPLLQAVTWVAERPSQAALSEGAAPHPTTSCPPSLFVFYLSVCEGLTSTYPKRICWNPSLQ